MRISTAEFAAQAVSTIDNQDSALAATQNEVSTGLAVPNAAANPVAASQILELQQQQSAITQYGTNLDSAQTRLTLEQTTLSNVTNTLQSIRDLVVQAGDGSLNNTDRQQIVTQIQTEYQALVASAARKLGGKNLDLIVGNDVSGTETGFDSDFNSVVILGHGGFKRELPRLPKPEVAAEILDEVLRLRARLHARA